MPRPKGKYIVSSIWTYKIYHAVDGNIVGYKARLVARGFSQKEEIDYKDTFAPVTRYTSIRSIRAGMRWEIHRLTSRQHY